MHCRGIEPRSPAWQARILPLNQQCLRYWWIEVDQVISNYISDIYVDMRAISPMVDHDILASYLS